MKLSDVLPFLFEDLTEGLQDEDRYHKDIGFPDDLMLPRGFGADITLRYGDHAREEAMKEKYGLLQLPKRLDLRKVDMFEVATDPGKKVVKKICIRMSHDDEKDIIIVINIPSGMVRTVWANLKSDKHNTLNRANYVNPNARKQQHQQHQPQQRRYA